MPHGRRVKTLTHSSSSGLVSRCLKASEEFFLLNMILQVRAQAEQKLGKVSSRAHPNYIYMNVTRGGENTALFYTTMRLVLENLGNVKSRL